MDSIYTDGTYLRNNPDWHADDSAWKAAHIAGILERNRIAPKTVCEVGCGAGEILVELSRRLAPGTRLTGYDISPNAYAICSRKAGPNLEFRLGNVLEEDASFDLAMAIDVFEHVEDYFAFLRAMRGKASYKIFHIPLELSALWVARPSPLIRQRRSVGHIHHFYTAGATDLAGHGWKSQVLKWPRKALYKLDPDAAARILGGYSLLVLAR